MTTTSTPVIDDEIQAFSDQVVGAALGAVELTVAHFGRRLGLYGALREAAGGLTAPELAQAAGIDARYAREWLEHQAVAGVLTVDDEHAAPDDRRFALPDAHAIAMLDEEHPAYVGALIELPSVIARTLDDLTDAFRTGAGIPFAAYAVHDLQAGMTRPMFANSLVDEWLPALPDIHGRLEAGETLRILDVGCGEGWAAIYIAEAYPAVTVHGVDLDDVSIAAARRHAAARGVADRVTFDVADVAGASTGERYDLALACEVVHDLADPVSVLDAMRRVTDDGAVFIIDENADEHFTASGDPIQRLLYSFSILHCLPAGRHGDESVATGTVMRPDTFRSYATSAGFARVEQLPLEHPMFRFYRLWST
jgi:2-polyprenyl-3-methyl-5-hydroxy-6-metoxy-1,4-benzoquinol methylase